MEYKQGAYIQEDKIRGMYVNMGNERTNSNGHGEGKEEKMKFIETIKVLKKNVQSYKSDNERVMKGTKKQEGFDIKLMKILERIENNMDKDIDSRKSGSHGSHDEGRRTRSVGRYHHHSPRNSTRRVHSISSPSPMRKHNRRYGVDEIQGEMNKI